MRDHVALPTPAVDRGAPPLVLGLRANLGQFLLLVLINAFVGAMVGLERTVVPLIAQRQFGVASAGAALSFIISFGVVKALTNFFAGGLSDRFGRRGVLVAGWLIGLPVPLIILWAPAWGWIVAANVLLGVNQALCWSMTVNMKIDLVGPARRGLALGLNESAGYGAVGLATLASGALAAAYGLRQGPFTLGIAFPVLGLLLSALFVRETHGHMRLEARQHSAPQAAGERPSLGHVFALASWRNRDLFACSQAGLVNNLNDGMSWGIFPLFFVSLGLGVERIGILKAVYPATWGILQVATGPLSDRWGRKALIVGGMWVQAAGLFLTALTRSFEWWLLGSLLLGLGTAMVYPSLIAAVSDASHPTWRARSLSVYRFWRDLGYALGALSAGLIADWFGLATAINAIATLTFISGVATAVLMSAGLQPRINVTEGRGAAG
jgi:MFS family permease